tara:strand:- start:7698 stop:8264 length:567 start_codon:yes stop_codon:yes gene_type:complete
MTMSMAPESEPSRSKESAINNRIDADVAGWLETLRSADTSELPAHPSLLFFRHASIEMAIRASFIAAVDVVGFTHKVPHRRTELFRGLAVNDGELVPLMNLDGLLAFPPQTTEKDRVPRLVVVESSSSGGRWSMIVDMVHGVDMCDPETWRDPSETDACIEHIVPGEHGPARLLDCDRLSRLAEGAFQ